MGQRTGTVPMSPQSMQPAARPATNVLSHWFSLFDRGHFSSAEFYDSIEAEIAERKLPKLRASRPEFHEGGALSDKRVYLRLERERYAFDICAAPFGTGYFFSYRMIEKPRSRLAFVLIVAVLVVLGALVMRSGFNWMEVLIGILGIVLVVRIVMRLNAMMAQNDAAKAVHVLVGEGQFDSAVLNIAVVGEWYERVRADTYHRYDTRLLFQTLVPEIVKRHVVRLTSGGGVALVDAYEYSPLLNETYRAVKIERKV
jgi:hypothetical protein